jgi:hypothetical protein
MRRLALVLCLLVCVACAVAQNSPLNDPVAISFAQRALVVLTGGASVSNVVLNANVISIFGSDNNSGTAEFKAKGLSESRIDFNLNGATRSDVRNSASGAWQKNGGAATTYAGHNCRTDAVWFFPALSSLTQTANQNFVFKYIGQEQHGSVNAQHIRVFQIASQDPAGVLLRLSAMDFYLDVNSSLPLAIAFASHPDNDLNTDIATEVRFASYQTVSGVQIPFHFQQMRNGSVVLDATVTSAVLNAGVSDSLFNLQ